MRGITSNKELKTLDSKLRGLLTRWVPLPNMVMKAKYRYFRFITFDEIVMTIFFNHIKKYLTALDEDSMFVVGLSDSGVLYSAIEVLNTDTEDDYLQTINGFHDSTSIEMHASEVFLVFSESENWFIYGDRSYDLSICGFLDMEKSRLFAEIYAEDLLPNADEAAKYAFRDSKAKRNIFIENYG